MTIKLELLEAALRNALGDQLQSLTQALGEVTIVAVSYTHLTLPTTPYV